SKEYGAEIYLKREDLSPVRSYKLRGAYNAMRKVLAENPGQSNFVCASAGNHAQGVAFACQRFGVRGTVFMPVTTPQQKVMKTQAFGGEFVDIITEGDIFDQTLAAAQAHCAEIGAHFLAPFDDPDVIEGQASVGVEILAQLPGAPDVIILPVGGGGLASGIRKYFSEIGAQTEIWLVEPDGAPSLAAAMDAGKPSFVEGISRFVDGAAVAQIGDQTFEILKEMPRDHVFAVSEDRLCVTLIDMLNIEGVVLEPAGALSVDALRDLAPQLAGKTVVCVTSGGNFDFERLPEVKEKAQKWLGVKKYYILRLPQRPGALKQFLEMLGDKDDIVRFEYLKKSARNFGSVLLGIETDAADNFAILESKLRGSDFDFQDITKDPLLAEFLI
ncbi:MAG: threonine ammonia-lyase IlvA, partial [Mangrovicoccus sp.]